MKSKKVAIILAALLGGLGIHRFYLGRIFTGILYFIFSWTFFPVLLSLVDIIYYLWLSDVEFNLRYNEEYRQCQKCKEFIFKKATLCKHCGSEV